MDRETIQERFGITGSSAAIKHVIDQVRLVARTPVTVLVQGESGVGKELVAHAIHELSDRRHGSLIIVNCGAIPEGLLESELFGTEKGAYTGAVERRSGYFEEADGGTIFLDEIGEMPAAAQVRLLRVLESGEFSRVGSAVNRKTDARVLAATNKELSKEVEAGRFREDLFYRLSTVIVNIAPLRQRREDILPIFEQFLRRFSEKYGATARRLEPDARDLLLRYRWPGNVRELRNVAERSVVLLRGQSITADDIRPHLRGVTASDASMSLVPVRSEAASGDERERELVYRALLELRMEIRELKEQIKMLAGGRVPTARMIEPSHEGFVVERGDRSDFEPYVEEIAYEFASEEEPGGSPASLDDGEEAAGDVLPTLADAERELIERSL
jgi:transcriptional regulator with PAS, ATPase and Fis domain